MVHGACTINSWKETEHRKYTEFLELEMQIWKEMFTHSMDNLDCEGDQDEENENNGEAENNDKHSSEGGEVLIWQIDLNIS